MDSVTVEELTAVLTDEFKRRRGNPPEKTLFTQKKINNKRKAPNKSCSICGRDNHNTDKCRHKGKPKCGYCQKLGHAEDDCWKKNSSPAKKAKTQGQANFASSIVELSSRDVQDDEQVLHADGNWTSDSSSTTSAKQPSSVQSLHRFVQWHRSHRKVPTITDSDKVVYTHLFCHILW